MARDPSIYVATGRKGAGKTTTSNQTIIKPYIKPPQQGGQGKNVLIFDTNNEYSEYPTIALDITLTKQVGRKKVPNNKAIAEHVTNWCIRTHKGLSRPQIRRVVPFRPNRDPMTIKEQQLCAEVLLKFFKGGLLVLDDLNNYMLGARSLEMIGSIVSNRHRNQDILIHFQSLSALDPRLWGNTNIVRMHPQLDPLRRSVINKISNPELFTLAKHVVDQMQVKNPYAYLYILPLLNKMKGVTKEEFIKGCEDYIRSSKYELKVTNLKQYTKNFARARMHYIE